MENTLNQEQKHIKSLTDGDKDNQDTIDGFYQQAMTIVSSHLQDFYNEYAEESGLTLNEVSSAVNSWDINQFHNAILVLLNNIDPDDNLSKRLQVAYSRANVDKRNLMNSMIAIGIDVGTFKAQNFGNKELTQQYKNEFNYRSPVNVNPNNIPDDAQQNPDFNQNIWNYSDVAQTRAEESLNKGLQKGMNRDDMTKLTRTYSTQDKRVDNNISSSANNILSSIQRDFKMQSVINTDSGKQDAYERNDSNNNYVKWVTERDDRVCEICEGMDGQVFSQDDAPTPQIDTHPQCRCSEVECDENGELSNVYP